MKNSRWMGSRIGLVDFWYYGDQEYEFSDGRMLLRGANGSGKSVTMQSFVPLLLDGNMRPERLDPFGSRARKMENYLLEEDDVRDERIGYLYMEFKREESETYLTFGMGIRARKGKPLETWYFYIQDGRRIGRDFLLYKEGKEKLVLTKMELRNRIGDGGRVIDSQSEYEKCVNELLFGFETAEEYRELLSLLIQLRTPKLSKDFKPSVINEILSSSLQTLSEEDLRPMSEAIENMDSLGTNLRTLEDCVKAAEDIQKEYDKYNKAVLKEKAEKYLEEEKAYRKNEKEVRALEQGCEQAKRELEEEKKKYTNLENEYEVLDREFKSLQESDAAKLKEKEQTLQQEQKNHEETLQKKEEQTENKKTDLREKEAEHKEHTGRAEQFWDELEHLFSDIKDEMEESPFSEWEFMIEELKKSKEKSCDFSYQDTLLKNYIAQVQSGIDVLKWEEETKRNYNDALQEMDRKKDARNEEERELLQYERLVREQKGELTEAVHRWSENNTWIKLEELELQQMSRQIETFQYETDYSLIRDTADKKRQETRNGLSDEKNRIAGEQRQQEEEKQRLTDEITKLEQAEEVEPKRSQEVIKNREQLKNKGIPVMPFYKVIDFEHTLSGEQCNRLEAAFSQMGILDALVLAPDYREQVLELEEEGVCDRYLFTDAARLQENMLDLFTLENAENNIMLYMQVQNLLSAVGYGFHNDARVWIDEKGRYGMGILEGNVSSEYEAKYIGMAAREKNRLACIAKLKEELAAVEEQLNELTRLAETVGQQLEQLEEEFKKFPAVDDLREALKEEDKAKHLLEQAKEAVRKQEQILQEWEAKLKEIQGQMQEVCRKTGLAGGLDIYLEEREHLETYREEYQEVKTKHGKYLDTLAWIQSDRDQIEKLELDLDELIYEMQEIRKKYDLCLAELKSVREQLKLTDYDEVKERLEHCVKRLDSHTGIPKEKEDSRTRQGKLEAEIKNKTETLNRETENLLHKDIKRKQWEKVFLAEYRLGYVPCDFVQTEESKELAGRTAQMLYGQTGTKGSLELVQDLQKVFYEKRGVLTEYQPVQRNNVFEELQKSDADKLKPEEVKRIDFRAKYRGTEISFPELVLQLHSDMEKLGSLLSEKDRELFEDILSNTISRKVRAKIQESNRWVEAMNQMMESMETSSGLTLSLKWQPKKAEKEGQLDTRELVDLLQTDAEIMRQEDINRLSSHFRSCISEARKQSKEEHNLQSFHVIMREILDYRKWFEFQLYFQKTGEKKKEMTDRMFFTFSGGEKAMSMYVPLFSAVVAKYKGANEDAPRIISLDEAFAGVDEMNIKDMFRLMIQLELNFIINSQVLWGDYDTVPSLAIYHLIRPLNAKCVTVIKYIWNGKVKALA